MQHHSSPSQEGATLPRALLIAFHFPPQSESSGIQRTLSFSRHLAQFGWTPMVLSAHPMAYERKNASQLASLPPELIVRRPLALDAKRHLGWKGRYLQLTALPDRWISWWLFALPCALAMVRKHKPAVIWSTFPISTAHLIGLCLHRLTGLPWVADFRDPMLQSDFPSNRWQRKLFGWIERLAIRHCTHATFTTQGALESYRARFPQALHHKFVVIENGYDEQTFAQEPHACALPGQPGQTRPLTLVHSGVLYTEGRDPSAFFQALAMLRARGLVDAQRLRVILRAPGDLDYFTQLAQRCGVIDLVHIAPPVPYRQALHEMLEADGLLVFQGRPFNRQAPAKIYEYFRARKPVLGLLDLEGETAGMLRSAGFPDLVEMTDPEAIAPVLTRFLRAISDGTAHVASEALVAASSRTHRTRQLAELFTQSLP
ncbi:glycosyltransferase [Herbaspirillum seropedicae]|uniref:glycosyltransferase n=1 Tax=Herbaspirillum seropedicae TaxID=964 RepID=UPI0011200A75|nr:glycosyltransferase [Herbaspirillum seropedicae]QDD65145.1 glycosyltransferase [Herbaspirillum seropedicae]